MLKLDEQCSKVIILMYILEVTHKITLYIGYGYGEVEVLVAQSCLTLCRPMDCSLLGAFVHGILQARILKWVAISSSRGSSRLRDRTHVSWTGGCILYHWAPWEAHRSLKDTQFLVWVLRSEFSKLSIWTFLCYCDPNANRKLVKNREIIHICSISLITNNLQRLKAKC